MARNSANVRGGGTRAAIVDNALVYENWAPNDANYSFEFGGSLAWSCAAPLLVALLLPRKNAER